MQNKLLIPHCKAALEAVNRNCRNQNIKELIGSLKAFTVALYYKEKLG